MGTLTTTPRGFISLMHERADTSPCCPYLSSRIYYAAAVKAFTYKSNKTRYGLVFAEEQLCVFKETNWWQCETKIMWNTYVVIIGILFQDSVFISRFLIKDIMTNDWWWTVQTWVRLSTSSTERRRRTSRNAAPRSGIRRIRKSKFILSLSLYLIFLNFWFSQSSSFVVAICCVGHVSWRLILLQIDT